MDLNEDYLKRFTVVKPKSEAQQRSWDRADAVIEVTKFLHFAEVYQLTAHLEPTEMIHLMDRAKKEGESPKSYFRHLIKKHE